MADVRAVREGASAAEGTCWGVGREAKCPLRGRERGEEERDAVAVKGGGKNWKL